MINTEIKLIKSLPKGWDDTLYKLFNGQFTKSHIRNVVSGNRKNIDIFESAIQLAEQYQSRLQSIKEKLDNLS